MSFTTKNIQAKTLCIIDIGSYKIRTIAARFKNKKIEILGYYEKRQDSSYFSNQECYNLAGLTENISETIEILENKIDFPLDEIVLNYPFGELFFRSKNINYKREHPSKNISYDELEQILQNIEKLCIKKLESETQKFYGLSPKEIQILISRITRVSLDGSVQKKIIGKTGKQLNISLINGFIPKSKEQILLHIGKVLKKRVFRILPIEYCLTKIFAQKNYVLINLGALQTTISVVSEGNLVGISKIPIGIQDLVQKISKHHSQTKSQVIQNLDLNTYEQEKKSFLAIWGEGLTITLKEILEEQVCPHNFYIGGGGGKNNFIQTYIQNFSSLSSELHFNKKIQLIREDMSPIFSLLKYIRIDDIEKIPLDIYVLIVEVHTILSEERDMLSTSLKSAIQKLGYGQHESAL